MYPITFKKAPKVGTSILTAFFYFWLFFFTGYACSDTTGQNAMNSNTVCKLTPVKQSLKMIHWILDDVDKNYGHEGGGGVSEIKQIATNTFRVSISQEERIDQITYEMKISPSCEVINTNKSSSSVSPWE